MATTKNSSGEILDSDKLDQWIKFKLNVLFKGKHGVGKTSIIIKAFKRAGLRYAYFSGATMDPHVDFLGIPVKVHNSKTGKEYIKLLRPQHIEDLDVQAIFFDEFNRTHKKIRNAVMELLQFKTVNGQPISSDLRIIWAAVNPDDDEGEYDVDRLDPAQEDRFQIKVHIPYECSPAYFERKYGDEGITAVRWWNSLDSKLKDLVSPRRLDYALKHWSKDGDLRDVLPIDVNPGKLKAILKGGYSDLSKLVKGDPDKAKEFFADEGNYATYIDEVLRNKDYHALIDILPSEKIAALISNPRYKHTMVKHIQGRFNAKLSDNYVPILKDIVTAGVAPYTIIRWASKCVAIYEAQQNKKTKATLKTGNKPTLSISSSGITSTYDVLLALCQAAVKTSTSSFSMTDVQTAIKNCLGRTSRPNTIVHKVAHWTPKLKHAGFKLRKIVDVSTGEDAWIVK